jgi:transcriptional regulator with XRE-family HTH domain
VEAQPFYTKDFLPLPEFPQHFREVMAEYNITQYALQNKTGISWNNFHKWLKGERLPYANSLLKLASALGCSVDVLLGSIMM